MYALVKGLVQARVPIDGVGFQMHIDARFPPSEQAIIDSQCLKFRLNEDDVARTALFLASDEGSFINNQVILCDGGNAMRGFRI